MTITTDGFEFDFPRAINVFKFDEQDKNSPVFHGASQAMSAVDVMVELPDRYLFIEIKNPKGPADYRPKARCRECGHQDNPLSSLQASLIKKCRDTWLYRYCENKVDKPCHFICLITLDSTMTGFILNSLRNSMPAKKPSRWTRHFIEDMVAVNPDTWNKVYSDLYGTCRKL